MADGVRSYTDEELEAILRRALERQAAAGEGFGHDELIAAAREVGLDEEAVERAIHELSHERSEREIRDGLRRRRREQWLRHFVTYLAVVGGLLGMHALGLLTAWVFWVAFGWGILFALDTYGKLRAPTDEELDRERQRLNRHERRRAKAQARRDAKRRRAEERAQRAARRQKRSDAGEHLERVIEEGVTLLLGVAAEKLREANAARARGEQPPSTEFGRYVAGKKGRRAPAAPPSPEPAPEPSSRVHVRVETDRDELEEFEAELERRSRERKSRR